MLNLLLQSGSCEFPKFKDKIRTSVEGLPPSRDLPLIRVLGKQFCAPSAELCDWRAGVQGKSSVVLTSFWWLTEYFPLTEDLWRSLVRHVHMCTFCASSCVRLWSVCLYLITPSCLTASFNLKAEEGNQILLLLFWRVCSSKITTPAWERKKMLRQRPTVWERIRLQVFQARVFRLFRI